MKTRGICCSPSETRSATWQCASICPGSIFPHWRAEWARTEAMRASMASRSDFTYSEPFAIALGSELAQVVVEMLPLQLVPLLRGQHAEERMRLVRQHVR